MIPLKYTSNWQQKMNDLGKNKIPFLFIIDFLKQHIFISPYSEVNNNLILFQTPLHNNFEENKIRNNLPFSFKKTPIQYDEYLHLFQKVQQEINNGNSYLLNLTCSTKIECGMDLKSIFYNSNAAYKLFFEDYFVVFSPECFIKIKDNKIYTYPMKGTIDANIYNAKNIILNDKKEQFEHATIVDLLRNDLSKVSSNVTVNKYRFLQEIKTTHKNLLQVSSEISGELDSNYSSHLGDIFDLLLPAGSISGAPKQKTLQLISIIELQERNFYSGIFGVFDGENVDSGVMIRFIEKKGDLLYYKSGGGITAYSNAFDEYQEMIDKIYVPIY